MSRSNLSGSCFLGPPQKTTGLSVDDLPSHKATDRHNGEVNRDEARKSEGGSALPDAYSYFFAFPTV